MTIPECSKSRPDSNNATERMNAAAEQIYLSRAFFSSGFNYHKQFMDQYLPEGLIGEVGCGVAQASGYYNSPARQFVAFDLDVEIITAARDAYPRVLFIGADVSRLPVRDASLDAYIGLGIFELDGGGVAWRQQRHRAC